LWQVKVRDGSKDWGWCVVASEVKKAIRKKESLFFGRSFSFKGECWGIQENPSPSKRRV
jgi:hypothetical protein